tara:strand:- start:162 stop:356 length:195 start_codon:yes stop_codon:yes gene_type:complete
MDLTKAALWTSPRQLFPGIFFGNRDSFAYPGNPGTSPTIPGFVEIGTVMHIQASTAARFLIQEE